MELGIGIVHYSPIGRGFFAGKATKENLPANSALAGETPSTEGIEDINHHLPELDQVELQKSSQNALNYKATHICINYLLKIR
ncbi:hypothetical protein LguiA_015961 [Lonicera macranthoides]